MFFIFDILSLEMKCFDFFSGIAEPNQDFQVSIELMS